MNACSDCKTFKKAENCIRCFQDAITQHRLLKARYIALLEGIEEIVKTCSYIRAGDNILARLERERKKIE